MVNLQVSNVIYPPFSVSMCVYQKDNPIWFDEAIHSVINQTVKPKEIILVVDGLITEAIELVIKKYKKDCRGINFKVIRFKENRGHGIARRKSVKACSTEIIALMDADDICLEDRFEQQLKLMLHTKADVVGGNISEFISDVENIVAYRDVPVSDMEIKKYMRKRCPMNQVTVMFKKAAYDKAGGYQDWYCEEDYYLWLRMAEKKVMFVNTGTTLVNVRVGKTMYQRRGGIKYFQSEVKLQKYMLERNIIGKGRYILNILQRLIVQVLLPNSVRGWVFKKFARRESC